MDRTPEGSEKEMPPLSVDLSSGRLRRLPCRVFPPGAFRGAVLRPAAPWCSSRRVGERSRNQISPFSSSLRFHERRRPDVRTAAGRIRYDLQETVGDRLDIERSLGIMPRVAAEPMSQPLVVQDVIETAQENPAGARC